MNDAELSKIARGLKEGDRVKVTYVYPSRGRYNDIVIETLEGVLHEGCGGLGITRGTSEVAYVVIGYHYLSYAEFVTDIELLPQSEPPRYSIAVGGYLAHQRLNNGMWYQPGSTRGKKWEDIAPYVDIVYTPTEG